MVAFDDAFQTEIGSDESLDKVSREIDAMCPYDAPQGLFVYREYGGLNYTACRETYHNCVPYARKKSICVRSKQLYLRRICNAFEYFETLINPKQRSKYSISANNTLLQISLGSAWQPNVHYQIATVVVKACHKRRNVNSDKRSLVFLRYLLSHRYFSQTSIATARFLAGWEFTRQNKGAHWADIMSNSNSLFKSCSNKGNSLQTWHPSEIKYILNWTARQYESAAFRRQMIFTSAI